MEIKMKCPNCSSMLRKFTLFQDPTLGEVLMVQETVKKYSQEYGKYKLWKKLPRKMMYKTFNAVIDYLESSGKLMIDKKDGIVFWTYDPSPKLQRAIREGVYL